MRLTISNIATLLTNCTAVSNYASDANDANGSNLDVIVHINLADNPVWSPSLSKFNTKETLKRNKIQGVYTLYEGAKLDLVQSDDTVTFFIRFTGTISENGKKTQFDDQTIATFSVN